MQSWVSHFPSLDLSFPTCEGSGPGSPQHSMLDTQPLCLGTTHGSKVQLLVKQTRACSWFQQNFLVLAGHGCHSKHWGAGGGGGWGGEERVRGQVSRAMEEPDQLRFGLVRRCSHFGGKIDQLDVQMKLTGCRRQDQITGLLTTTVVQPQEQARKPGEQLVECPLQSQRSEH